jgi:hypothetical protein
MSSRYEAFQGSQKRDQIDPRVWIEEEGSNKVWILPTKESDDKLFFYIFYIHKIIDQQTGKLKWVTCPRRTNFGNCPICDKGNKLWNTNDAANQQFAKKYLFAKVKYLLNVVPYNEQKTKIYVTDPRIVGYPPRNKDDKIFTQVFDRLITMHLAIDQETYEKNGKEVYTCPKIIGKDATYVIIDKSRNAGGYNQFKVSIPLIEEQRKPCPNYAQRLAERHDLKAFHDEIVITMTIDELETELERLLRKDGTVNKETNTEPVSESYTEPEKNEEEEQLTDSVPGDLSHLIDNGATTTDDTDSSESSPPPTCYGKGFDETQPVCAKLCEHREGCQNLTVQQIVE